MKTKLAALIVALLSICLVARPSVMAIGISIEIGDRPYYDGPFFWDEGYYWVWIPGHWEDHHWIHGHYVRQGVFHIEHKYEHHHHKHHDHDEHHDKDHHDKDHHDKGHDHH
jgi:hypothetical protein